MTRFGIVGLGAIFLLVAAAVVKADTPEVRNVLAVFAAVLLGAVITTEARHMGGDDDHRPR